MVIVDSSGSNRTAFDCMMCWLEFRMQYWFHKCKRFEIGLLNRNQLLQNRNIGALSLLRLLTVKMKLMATWS
jgi:hypothetical protein